MPLLDHFQMPVLASHPWEGFHSNWAGKIADALNDILPPEFFAVENLRPARALEVDIATREWENAAPAKSNGPAVATAPPQVYAPPAPALVVPCVFPESFLVQVFWTRDGHRLVGAIELVSPANKDRPAERRAFATKIASYLHEAISVLVVDTVTTRLANLHNETMRLMETDVRTHLPAEVSLYAVAYRPALREDRPEFDIWTERLSLGGRLPTMPLRLRNDLFVPVDLDATYNEACRRRRLA